MISVFISSTFKDMQAERDILHEVVFPRLNLALRDRGYNIQELDLRWGVDTSGMSEEESGRQVLKVCIDAIDRCRPYTVVLLGERYGWIPGTEIVNEADDERISEVYSESMSITNLEIDYAALNKANDLERCIFCFRDPSFIESIEGVERDNYTAESDRHQAKLLSLKKTIRELPGAVMMDYAVKWDPKKKTVTALEDFTERIYELLIRMIDRDTERSEETGSVGKMQAVMSAMKELYRASYIPRAKEEYEMLMRLRKEASPVKISKDKNVICLKGDAGSGKSCLMAQCEGDLSDAGKRTILFFAGAPGCGNTKALKETAACRLREILSVSEDEVPGTSDETLIALNEKIDRENIYCFIDAVDQLFEGKNDYFLDIFSLCPKLIFVLSCVPGFPVEMLVEKTGCGLVTVELPPLYACQAESVVKASAGRRGKKIDDRVTELIIDKGGADNPLYLSFVLQRLFMMDKNEFEDAEKLAPGMEGLHLYMERLLSEMPQDKKQMIRYLIDSVREKFGSEEFHDLMKYMASSVRGLTETELEMISDIKNRPWSQMAFQRIVSYLFDAFGRQDDGKWSFSHRLFKEAMLEEDPEGKAVDVLADLAAYDRDFRMREGYYYLFRKKRPEGVDVLREASSGNDAEDIARCIAELVEDDPGTADYFEQMALNEADTLLADFWTDAFKAESLGDKGGICQTKVLKCLLDSGKMPALHEAKICSILAQKDFSIFSDDELAGFTDRGMKAAKALAPVERAAYEAKFKCCECIAYYNSRDKERLYSAAKEACALSDKAYSYVSDDTDNELRKEIITDLVSMKAWYTDLLSSVEDKRDKAESSLRSAKELLEKEKDSFDGEEYFRRYMWTVRAASNYIYYDKSAGEEERAEKLKEIYDGVRPQIFSYPAAANLRMWGDLLFMLGHTGKITQETLRYRREESRVRLRLFELLRDTRDQRAYIDALIGEAEFLYRYYWYGDGKGLKEEAEEKWVEIRDLMRDLRSREIRLMRDADYGFRLLKYCSERLLSNDIEDRYLDKCREICLELADIYDSDQFDDGGYSRYTTDTDLRDIYHFLGEVSSNRCDHEEAASYFGTALEYSEKLLAYKETPARINRHIMILSGYIKSLLKTGRAAEALKAAEDIYSLVENHTDKGSDMYGKKISSCLRLLAEAQYDTGNVDAARELLAGSEKNLPEDDRTIEFCYQKLLKAKIALHDNDPETSRHSLSETETVLKKMLDMPFRSNGYFALQKQVTEAYNEMCMEYKILYTLLGYEDVGAAVEIKKNEAEDIIADADKRGFSREYLKKKEEREKKYKREKSSSELAIDEIKALREQCREAFEKDGDPEAYKELREFIGNGHIVETEGMFDLFNECVKEMKDASPDDVREIEEFEQEIYIRSVEKSCAELKKWSTWW